MTNQTQELPRVERGQSYLVVPYGERELSVAHPLSGPNAYVETGKDLFSRDLSMPTGVETAFVLDEIYNSKNDDFKSSPEAENVRDVMKNNYLWVRNRNIWTKQDAKNPGVYIVYDNKAEGVSAPFNLSELEDRLSGGSVERGVRFSKDRVVSFAPANTFSLGKQSSKDLSQSGFVIANYGVEGAEKLSKVASVFAGNPYIYGVSGNNEDVQRVACLNRSWSLDVRLGLDGNDFDSGRVGFSFGVRSAGEASMAKK